MTATFKTALRCVVLTATMLVAVLASAGAANAASTPNTALINGESVTTNGGLTKGGEPISLEQYSAEQAGYTVTIVSGTEWEALTAAQFAQYQVLIVGDPICSSTAVSANNNAGTWAPVVMGKGPNPQEGNRALVGTDPEFHFTFGHPGAQHLVQDGITFAGQVKGATGVYYDTSCFDPGSDVATLDQLTTTGPGHWTENPSPPCGGSVQLIASNPAFDTGPTKLENTDIQGWFCSDHVSFPGFPADWNALAVATDTETKPTCGTDPRTEEFVCGQAYVLLAGAKIVTESELKLTPKEATNPVGSEHTVTATLTETKEGTASPVVGAVITFVVTGQNVGVTGTCTTTTGGADPGCETDSTGGVRFTYKDINGAGEDTIHASTKMGETTESATASKTWVETGGCSSIVGVGHLGPKGPAGLNLNDNLNTSLAGKQQFEFTTGESEGLPRKHMKLTHLASASCVATAGGKQFSGTGTGTFAGVKGDHITFSWTVEAGAIHWTVVVEEGGSVVFEKSNVTLNPKSHEVIS